MVFRIGQRLGRCNHDALPGVDTQGVEVFHVANRDAVIEPVADHLILHLFPALQRFLDKDLGTV